MIKGSNCIVIGIMIMILSFIYIQLNPCSDILNMSQAQQQTFLKQNPQYKTIMEAFTDCDNSHQLIPVIGFMGGLVFIIITLYTPYLKEKKNATNKCFQCNDMYNEEDGIDYHGSWLCINCLRGLSNE